VVRKIATNIALRRKSELRDVDAGNLKIVRIIASLMETFGTGERLC
jgi:hypothetical protein